MNKTIVVTGARRGLGLAITRRLAAEGYRVLAVARSTSPELTQLSKGGDILFDKFDLSNVAAIHEWASTISRRYGRIYGLVNNAAIGSDGILATMHESEIANLLTVNLHAPILLSKYFARSMLLNGSGRIVNISSIIASTGFSGLSVYGATKAGLIGFSKSLARELGKAAVTVNCVAPGYMETEMTQGLSASKLESIKRRSPSGRLAEVDDVAAAVSFLLGPQAKMINGTTITVDAGSTA